MATIGVLMLETRFPRPPGDIGNPAGFPFPLRYAVVPRARVGRVVRPGEPDPALLEGFLAAAERLAAEGCAALTTSCGFLAPFQAALAARAGIPVAASALLLVPMLQATLPPGRRVGVLTVDAAALGPAHLAAAGAAPDTPVEGIEREGELARVLLDDLPELDTAAAGADVVAAGERLRARHPEVGAIVLECTNMPPYAAALRRATGLPVQGLPELLAWLHAGLPALSGPASSRLASAGISGQVP